MTSKGEAAKRKEQERQEKDAEKSKVRAAKRDAKYQQEKDRQHGKGKK